jgi:hypothetical protein
MPIVNSSRFRRYGFALLAAALAVAGLASVAAPALAGAPRVGPVPAKLVPNSAKLNSVYCTGSTDCWAAGFQNTAKSALVNQIVRWNGKKWTAVPVPNPGGTKMDDDNQLISVRCTSAANCWAVGFYNTTSSSLPQALHWNGKKWGQVTVPVPGGTGEDDFTFLNDVSCVSASDCWAVGDYGNNGVNDVGKNLVLHWTGKKWFKVTVSNPAGTKQDDFNVLDAVRCASANDCWAAGTAGVDSSVTIQENEMLHWNGTKWSEADVPSPAGSMVGAISEIEGLSCTSAKDCWAVGDYGGGSVSDSTFLNMALHWNGHNWSQVKTPNPDGTGSGDSNFLSSVTCTAANNCWTAGTLGGITSGDDETGEALHWQGTKWSLTTTPNPGGTAEDDQNELNSVRCNSAKDCWIVGFSRVDPDPDHNLILHWNSHKWSA